MLILVCVDCAVGFFFTRCAPLIAELAADIEMSEPMTFPIVCEIFQLLLHTTFKANKSRNFDLPLDTKVIVNSFEPNSNQNDPRARA